MKKITARQNEIYKAHVRAWRDDNFSYEYFQSASQLRDILNEGKTLKVLWRHFVDKLPVMSQLMMTSTAGVGVMSNTAKTEIRRGFKELLTKLDIV